ncbi:MAG: hypothetical protein QG637_400 [Chloroflexota bacterium]|nr:hypothetical protein [Chloroflexota bacterium]
MTELAREVKRGAQFGAGVIASGVRHVFVGRSEAISTMQGIALLRSSQPQTTLLAMTTPELKHTRAVYPKVTCRRIVPPRSAIAHTVNAPPAGTWISHSALPRLSVGETP